MTEENLEKRIKSLAEMIEKYRIFNSFGTELIPIRIELFQNGQWMVCVEIYEHHAYFSTSYVSLEDAISQSEKVVVKHLEDSIRALESGIEIEHNILARIRDKENLIDEFEEYISNVR